MIDDSYNFDTLWNYNDPAATEQQFRSLLSRAEQGDDRSYHGQLLTQIARAQGLQGNFADAHTTLDAAQALLDPDLSLARSAISLSAGGCSTHHSRSCRASRCSSKRGS